MTVIFKNYSLFHVNSDFDSTIFTIIDSETNKLVYLKKYANLNDGIPYVICFFLIQNLKFIIVIFTTL